MKSALNKLCWVQDMVGHGWAGMDVKYIFIFRAAATCLEVDPSPMPAVGGLQDQAKNSLAAPRQSFLFPSVWAGIPHGVAAGEGRREERGDQVKTLRHLGFRAGQGEVRSIKAVWPTCGSQALFCRSSGVIQILKSHDPLWAPTGLRTMHWFTVGHTFLPSLSSGLDYVIVPGH